MMTEMLSCPDEGLGDKDYAGEYGLFGIVVLFLIPTGIREYLDPLSDQTQCLPDQT